jgi:hypothetical protein
MRFNLALASGYNAAGFDLLHWHWQCCLFKTAVHRRLIEHQHASVRSHAQHRSQIKLSAAPAFTS